LDEQAVKDQVNEWYYSFSKDIHQYIFFLSRDHEQAKDLMQETFLRAFRHYHSFSGENVKGWLFRIARNVTIDYMRRKKPISYFMDSISLIKSTTTSPEQAASFNETERELHTALNKIKSQYRDVIILRKMEEFSIQETSEILGWSESKVKITLLRGIKALKLELEKAVGSNEAI
jgi:RNA polymerase sigma-70 factor, ECF subfamily